MNKEVLDEIAKTIGILSEQIRDLRRKVYFQDACFQALRAYVLRRIAELGKANQAKEVRELNRLLRATYDQYISKIENVAPAFAADIDIRAAMGTKEQQVWYLALDDLLNKDDSPGEESEGSK